jgi:hypothetical protein
MYQFKEGCNHKQFFWWSKRLIKNKNWALLSKSSKAVFPVIACHCNKKGGAYPNERTIAILSGLNDKSAREGIRGLEAFPNFKISHYLTKRGKRAKKYYLNLPAANVKGRSFPFYKFILESGQWKELKPTAKALYPVMRYFSFFDINIYSEIEDLGIDEGDYNETYPDRKYDFCEAEKKVMADLAGINRRSMNTALNDLERNMLIEPIGGNYGWKVFPKSKDDKIFKRSYLNEKIKASYKHTL